LRKLIRGARSNLHRARNRNRAHDWRRERDQARESKSHFECDRSWRARRGTMICPLRWLYCNLVTLA
jgi:hypothetical protein